ncbi:MAG: efflux RND transporter periplasmic adaptor subunit [Candidatus Protistobacter heckmanni]|nr:efflux RND transporter periplasmic adaptor subunit [Candidatus Protistobacter heckmanni]
MATGSVQTFRLVDVGSQVSGQIKVIHVKLGERVQKGKLLAEIDPTLSQNDLRAAEVSHESTLAQRCGAEAALRQAELGLERQPLLQAGDAAARHDLKAAQAQIAAARASLESLDAQINGSLISIETVRARLAYTRIVAPMDGEVIALVSSEGQTVVASQQAPVILCLADLASVTIRAEVSEADVIRLREGQAVSFTILGNADKHYRGNLRTIEPAPSGYTGDAGRAIDAVFYNVLFDVPNPGRELRLAMTTQVNIVTDEADGALLIPVAALGARLPGGGADVQVLDAAGQPTKRRIRTGVTDNVRVQVLECLCEGERVVLAKAAVTPDEDEPGFPFGLGN